MKPNEKPEQSPASIVQRLLARKKFTQENFPLSNARELRTAQGRRTHKLGTEILKEKENARKTHS